MKFLTILTPTYNRAYKLENLYESLKRQINKNFVWYVIDDGSTDNTKELIQRFQKENLMEICYQRQENGGKHRAINAAAKHLESELTMIVDSDDLLTPDATETIFNDWIENCENGIGGLVYLRGYSGFEVIGDKWPYDEQFGNTIKNTCNKGIKGDKAEVFQSELLKKYMFPEFEGEKFLSEACVWIEIAKTTNVFMRNKIIYITEYQEDGLTERGRKMQVQNPKGAVINARAYMWKGFNFKIRLKNAILYHCYGSFAGISAGDLWKESPDKLCSFLGFLPGMILKKKWEKYL